MKNPDFTQKNHIFSNLRGGGGAPGPTGSVPGVIHTTIYIQSKYSLRIVSYTLHLKGLILYIVIYMYYTYRYIQHNEKGNEKGNKYVIETYRINEEFEF